MTVFHAGTKGEGLVTEQPTALVDRMVAPSRIASSVRNPFHGPCPPLAG